MSIFNFKDNPLSLVRVARRSECWLKGYALHFMRFDDNKPYKSYLRDSRMNFKFVQVLMAQAF